MSEGLENLRETITKFTRQGPATHRSEQDKTEYIHGSVIGLDWAKSVLSQSIASRPSWTFQQLYTALDAAWLQEQKQDNGNRRDRQFISPGNDSFRIPAIHYDVPLLAYSPNAFKGQSMYALPRRPGSSSSNPRRNSSRPPKPHRNQVNGKDRFGNTRACHNCGSKYHFIRDSNRPVPLTRNIGQTLKNLPNDNRHTKRILFE